MAAEILTCSNCDNDFITADPRSYLDQKDRMNSSYCPLCATLKLRSSVEWAVWNDCNGVFETFSRRAAAARECVDPGYVGAECRVVPVYVIEAPEGEEDFLIWNEADLVKGCGLDGEYPPGWDEWKNQRPIPEPDNLTTMEADRA